LGGAIGAALGSFIVTLVLRWPEPASALSGRSRCDGCGRPLPLPALVPVLSYVRQRGRARCCGASVDGLHLWGEVAAIMIGAVSLVLLGPQGWIAALFGWLLLTLALFDLRFFILPDWLTKMLALAAAAGVTLHAEPMIADRLIGGACGYATLQLIRLGYRVARGREGLGRGDPKLLGAIGLWTGWQPLPAIMLTAALIGLAIAGTMHLLGRRVTATQRMPLGTLMAAAAWPIWLWTQLHPGGIGG